MRTAYKFMGSGGLSPYQRTKWSIPHGGHPGRWMPRIKGPLVECENGYHVVTTRRGLVIWMESATALYEAAWSLQLIEGNQKKSVVRKARLIRRIPGFTAKNLREFGYRCVGHVLKQAEDGGIDVAEIRAAFEIGKTHPRKMPHLPYPCGYGVDAERSLIRAVEKVGDMYLKPLGVEHAALRATILAEFCAEAASYIARKVSDDWSAKPRIREERWQGRALAECIGLKPRTPIKVKVSESDGSPSGQGSVSV